MTTAELPPERVRLRCAREMLECETTEELAPHQGIIGQERALRALKFGLEMKAKGFNVYSAGLPGTGKNTATRSYLDVFAKSKLVPPDWCYVNNFQNPYEPRALKLPPGRALAFRKDMMNFISDTRRAVPAALGSDDFLGKSKAVSGKAEAERDKILVELNRDAERAGFVLRSTASGVMIIPVLEGKLLDEEAFQMLPPQVKAEFERKRDVLQVKLEGGLKRVTELAFKTRERIEKLTDDAIQYAIGFVTNDILTKYRDVPEVVQYLDEVRRDILDNAELFTERLAEPGAPDGGPTTPWTKELALRRYDVNVIVDNSELKGAPVVSEENPTYGNLIGRIEKESRLGALTTDFTLIRGGSLHKANGGFLIIRIEELLKNPFSYDGLKRSLQNEKMAIEEMGERLDTSSTKSLTPQPIPLDVKVVLVGSPTIYQLLYTNDADFRPLFKVKAHFDDTIARNQESMRMYAAFMCTLSATEGLRHLDSSAIAKVIEYGSRLSEDQSKLSTRFSEIADLLREASFYAAQDASKYIKDAHIAKALEERIYRSNLVDQKMQEMMERGLILIETSGEKVGQVNGLTVMSVGDLSFGKPSRVTASVALGREGVIDIEREAKMGGPIHTKGVLILSGYLASRYAQDKPLSLSARLVFEQSYGGVEGDSASSTELYAILSALSGLPVKQRLAVTGSVNQKGEVQAIGGVNEKVEGFYELCKARGLKGDEGVIIPESNVQNLMLKEEVVEAVRQGKFHVYPVSNIDQGIEILTGMKAGEKVGDGSFEPDTLNYRVDMRLREMAEELAKFVQPTERRGARERGETEED